MKSAKKEVDYQAKSHHFSGKMGVLRQAENLTYCQFLNPAEYAGGHFLYQKFPIDFKRCGRITSDNNFSTEIITNSIRIGYGIFKTFPIQVDRF